MPAFEHKSQPEAESSTKQPRYVSTAKQRPPMTEEERATMNKPKVLIVGAGIGGLILGAFLEKGGIPYQLFERASEVKPYGSAMSVGAISAHLFKQIGILDDLIAVGKPSDSLEFLNENLESLFKMDFTGRKEISGFDGHIVARPDLYALLLRQIPPEKIFLSKKILNFEQNDAGVMIRCNDGSWYHGDILVGADGAYSAVRQHLYKTLKIKKTLPASDDVPLPFSSVCLVGQTTPLDPEEFPDLKLPYSKFNTILGNNQYSWVRATTKGNTVCWIVTEFLTKESSKQNDSFRNSEWGPEAAETMCNEVRHLKMPGGKGDRVMTVGDYIDLTPKHLISKVMLEEKVFQTWYGGRTVLIGDACHKLNPAGGAGAMTAIQDAAALANWICTLQSKNRDVIENSFREYHTERYPVVMKAFETSKFLNHIGGKGIL
ncbi:hypothetical protein BG004_001586 [Podila humilis]|nr:hypothetical protein BG004_001586 [Podila humilis]